MSKRFPLEPARPAANLLRLHVVGGSNQVDHRGIADFVTIATQLTAAHARLRPGAHLNARDVECGARGGRLAKYGTGEHGGDGDDGKEPFFIRNLRLNG